MGGYEWRWIGLDGLVFARELERVRGGDWRADGRDVLTRLLAARVAMVDGFYWVVGRKGFLSGDGSLKP